MINISTGNRIFVDTSGFKAVFDSDDDFHQKAKIFWLKTQTEETPLITTNFILDETFTLFRSHMGKKAALELRSDIAESPKQIEIVRVTAIDEKNAWHYFEKLPGRGVSFTDCTSFTVMKRLLVNTAFTFDEDFTQAGFKITFSR